MEKEAASRKTKKNPSQNEPDGLKPKAIKREKKVLAEKQKKSIKAWTRRP